MRISETLLATFVLFFVCVQTTFPQWVDQSVQLDSLMRDCTDIHFVNQWTGYVSATFGGAYRTTDGGAHWTYLNTQIPASPVSVFALNEDTIYMGRTSLYRSADAGSTWDSVGFGNVSGSIADIIFTTPSKGFFVKLGKVLMTTDAGNSWVGVYDANYIDQLEFPSEQVGYVAGGITFDGNSVGVLAKTIDGGETWQDVDISFDGKELVGLSFLNDTVGYIMFVDHSLYVTSDGGESWTLQNGNVAQGLRIAFQTLTTGYISTSLGNILKTTDRGLTWLVDYDDPADRTLTEFYVLDSTTIFVVGNDGAILKKGPDPPPRSWVTLNLSSDWNLISVPLLLDDYSRLSIFPSSTSAFGYYGSYLKQDYLLPGAGYWIKMIDSSSVAIKGPPIGTDTIAVMNGWNIIGSIADTIPVSQITSDPGGLVTSQYFGYEGSYIVSDTIFPGKGYWVKVNQSGQLELSASSATVTASSIRIEPTYEHPPSPPGIESPQQVDNAKLFSLYQNYPNPFNPNTILRYELPVSSHVSLKIYNLSGQVVLTLVSNSQEAGFKSYEYDARNLSTGIYFFRLVATPLDGSRPFIDTKKMVLIK